MTETTQILLISLGAFIAAYAALPFIIKPRWKDLHGMANGRNGLLSIHVDPNAPHKLAVVAHELAEWQYKYKRPWLWTRFRSKAGARAVNLWGPAVETAFAVKVYGVDEHQFIKKEARALVGRSYFDGWPSLKIGAKIAGRLPEAREWVGKNMDRIQNV